ncbi:type II toxin-antitoxin system HicB family antitoxin [Polynucleobacter acidiphobus]|nr:hypothetical protein [Polynucleobacter acidiphobus]
MDTALPNTVSSKFDAKAKKAGETRSGFIAHLALCA